MKQLLRGGSGGSWAVFASRNHHWEHGSIPARFGQLLPAVHPLQEPDKYTAIINGAAFRGNAVYSSLRTTTRVMQPEASQPPWSRPRAWLGLSTSAVLRATTWLFGDSGICCSPRWQAGSFVHLWGLRTILTVAFWQTSASLRCAERRRTQSHLPSPRGAQLPKSPRVFLECL